MLAKFLALLPVFKVYPKEWVKIQNQITLTLYF